MTLTFASLFSGGGGSDLGAIALNVCEATIRDWARKDKDVRYVDPRHRIHTEESA